MFGRPIVFVDANVWYSRTLRDWLGLLYTTGDSAPFQVRWTEDVLAELLVNLRRKHPEWDGGRISGTRDRITDTFEGGRVEQFVLDGSYRGKDPLDEHVHAAALACNADVLLTCNTADFRWDENNSPYDLMSPDEFFVWVDDVVPMVVSAAVVRSCGYWMHRSGEADLPHRLKASGCPDFAERVRMHLQGAAGKQVCP